MAPTGIPSRELTAILGSLPEGSLTLTPAEDGGEIVLTSGRSRIALRTLGANDFLAIGAVDESVAQFTCPGPELARGLNFAAHACSDQETRYGMTHALRLRVDGMSVSCVGTDTHRMAYATLPVTASVGPGESLVPKEAAPLLAALLSEGEAAVRFNQHGLVAETGNVKFWSVVVAGGYPKIDGLIKFAPERTGLIPRDEILSICRRARILGSNAKDGMKDFVKGQLEFSFDSLQIQASGPLGNTDETLGIEYDGQFGAYYNLHFLIEGLDSLSGDKVTFNHAAAGRPVSFQSEEFILVVSPMSP